MAKLQVKLFSLPRTGGTLISNILTALNNNKRIRISHWFHPHADRVIIPVRDLRDSLVSHWRVMDGGFDEPKDIKYMSRRDIVNYVNDNRVGYWGHSFRSMMAFINFNKNKPYKNILYLYYEKFFNNYDYIFDSLENSFLKPLSISKKQRKQLAHRFSLKSQKSISKQYADFSSWDKKTMIHGLHIYKGTPGTWKQLVKKPDHQFITKILEKELKLLGYI